jgi:hypothetical protein
MRRFSRLLLLALLFTSLLLVAYRVSAASSEDEDVAVDEVDAVATEEEIEQLYADVEDDDSETAGGIPSRTRSIPANPTDTGYLILQKKIDTAGFAVGNNVTVEIKLFNVGGGPAYEVYVKDGWPLEHFKLLDGDLTGNFPVIEA